MTTAAPATDRTDINEAMLADYRQAVARGDVLAARAARDALALANLGLVYTIARHMARRRASVGAPCLPEDDLVQEGCLALLAAIDGYDPARGVRFSTYAGRSMSLYIAKESSEQAGVVHVPHSSRHVSRCHRATISAATLVARASAIASVGAIGSLDAAGPGKRTLAEVLEDRREVSPPDAAARAEARAAIDRNLTGLPPRDRDVLARHYALGGGEEETLEAIGASYGISKERVRQVKDRAMRRLREACGCGERDEPGEYDGADDRRRVEVARAAARRVWERGQEEARIERRGREESAA